MTGVEKLSWIMMESYHFSCDYGIKTGCLCSSCHSYKMSFTVFDHNLEDVDIHIEEDTLNEAISNAYDAWKKYEPM